MLPTIIQFRLLMKEFEYLHEKIIFSKDESDKKVFESWTSSLGVDKCVEICKNYFSIIKTKNVSFAEIFAFSNYDIALSETLFTLLRHQENYVKGFLCNVFNDYKVNIESRPSNYTKTKYYFKFPVGVNEYLDIRTFNYTEGPVDYYDALKTLDFGDVNLIMFHLPKTLISKFSSNPNILEELDQTRKLRNYVYHHNMLFSLGKNGLISAIELVIHNLPNTELKEIYINKINSLADKFNLLNEKILVKLD